jgi:DNA-binding CsgD family transcriptional regulator
MRFNDLGLAPLPGICVWTKDINSIYTNMNDEATEVFGFSNVKNSIGKSDHQIPCAMSDYATIFQEEDRKVMATKKKIQFLEMVPCATGDWKIFMVTKSPLLVSNKIAGTLGHCVNVTNAFSKLGMISSPLTKNSTTFPILNEAYEEHLSQRQRECLFFLLRGKTAKEIAKVLNISYRTVEFHINEIKTKFNCQKKSELIELAYERGFFNLIPNSCFNTAFIELG